MNSIKKILIDNSGYQLKNIGDTAMLLVATNRLQQLFPYAEIRVFTAAPKNLKKILPNAIPISLIGRNQWLSSWNVCSRLSRLLPTFIYSWLQCQENYLKLKYPFISRYWMSYKRYKKRDISPMVNFLQEISKADIVVATGGGYITDSFEFHATSLLQTLALAQSFNKPTALFGQGLGPSSSKQISYWTNLVFPNLKVLSVREGVHSKPFALLTNINRNKVVVTGDDAIQLAFPKKTNLLGRNIGVNLRVAKYSGIEKETVNIIKRVLNDAAKILDSNLCSIPISMHDGDSDLIPLQLLLGDRLMGEATNLDTPEKIIEQAGRCRIVITGSYHAGVFALSQGVSVIGVVASHYYRYKFEGLASQFKGGCQIINQNQPDFENSLISLIYTSWANAGILKPKILKQALEQVMLSENVYKNFGISLKSNN